MPIRILEIIPTLDRGGAEKQLSLLAAGLPRDRFEVHVCALTRGGPLMITKPGYGLVAEAACNGTPVLLLPRPGWPETPSFIAWLQRHGRVHPIPEEKLLSGEFLDAVHAVRALPAPPVPKPNGIAQIADELAERFD